MTEEIAKKGKTKKDPKLHPVIKQFMEEQNKFNADVKEFKKNSMVKLNNLCKIKTKNEKSRVKLIRK